MPSPPDPILPAVINVGPGGKGAWLQPGSYGRADSGYFTSYVYEGTRAEVEDLAAIFDASLTSFEINILHGGRARLNARRSTGSISGGDPQVEKLEDVWELEPQETLKELTEADLPNPGALPGLTAADRLTLIKELNTDPGEFGHTDAYLVDTFAGCNDPATVKSFYYLMHSEVKLYPQLSTVVRHTEMVSNVYAVELAFTNVGRILSRDAMISLEGAAPLFLFSIPPSPTVATRIEHDDDLQYGWRKTMPRVTRLTFDKWQIQNVWQFGLWAIKLHGDVIG